MTRYSSYITDSSGKRKLLTKRKGESSRERRERKEKEKTRPLIDLRKQTPTPIDLRKQKEPIKLKKKTGISAYREKKTIGGYATKIMTSPKTTVALGTTLATLFGAGAVKGIFTAAKAGGKFLPAAMAKVGRQVNVNAIGKAAGLTSKQTAKLATRVGYERINVLARYAVNPKTTGLTKSFMIKLGLGAGTAGLAITAIGTYPFAGFIKEEALQTLGIPIMKAIDADDMETARKQTEAIDEILARQGDILDKIPFANVLKSLKQFFEAAEISNEAWKEIISSTEEKEKEDTEKWEDIEEKRKEKDIEEEEKYKKIEEKRKEKDIEEEEKYKKIEEKRKAEDLAEMQWKAEYYKLIREGKFEEANELLESQK